ncbi:hypothetical protein [Lyticum sinuosum]|uniref:Uncharacterized protein n=1 Tax=Lyticum sinuosum TaxID=1332059 RepID=A0AAE5AHJ9_9RICK|nr:hypothetical protein [Lyticum sinuosum]MDZ5761640.1 hypothetical protein [Lyticum sinuosum]
MQVSSLSIEDISFSFQNERFKRISYEFLMKMKASDSKIIKIISFCFLSIFDNAKIAVFPMILCSISNFTENILNQGLKNGIKTSFYNAKDVIKKLPSGFVVAVYETFPIFQSLSLQNGLFTNIFNIAYYMTSLIIESIVILKILDPIKSFIMRTDYSSVSLSRSTIQSQIKNNLLYKLLSIPFSTIIYAYYNSHLINEEEKFEFKKKEYPTIFKLSNSELSKPHNNLLCEVFFEFGDKSVNYKHLDENTTNSNTSDYNSIDRRDSNLNNQLIVSSINSRKNSDEFKKMSRSNSTSTIDSITNLNIEI